MSAELEESNDIKQEITKHTIIYVQKVVKCPPAAIPMATEDLAKRCCQLLRKARYYKSHIKVGKILVYEHLLDRITTKRLVVLAGDVSRSSENRDNSAYWIIIQLCTLKEIPYIHLPSKRDIAHCLNLPAECSAILIRQHRRYHNLFEKCEKDITYLSK